MFNGWFFGSSFCYPGAVAAPTIRPRGRFSVERHDDRLWIFLGPRRIRRVVVHMALWLCLWAAGEVFLLWLLLMKILGVEGDSSLPGFLPLLMFPIWTLLGGVAVHTFVAEMWRREEIYFSHETLFKRVCFGPWKRDTLIRLSDVRELRVTTPPDFPKDWVSTNYLPGNYRVRGIAVLYDNEKSSLLVMEDQEEVDLKTGSESDSIVAQTVQALEAFRVSVTPLTDPRPNTLLELLRQFRDAIVAFGQAETNDHGDARPTGPVPRVRSGPPRE